MKECSINQASMVLESLRNFVVEMEQRFHDNKEYIKTRDDFNIISFKNYKNEDGAKQLQITIYNKLKNDIETIEYPIEFILAKPSQRDSVICDFMGVMK